jgi:hypothetical protein
MKISKKENKINRNSKGNIKDPIGADNNFLIKLEEFKTQKYSLIYDIK